MKNLLIMILALGSLSQAIACDQHGLSGIVQDNDLYIPAGLKSMQGLTKAQFNSVIDQAEKIYSPIVSKAGGKLMIQRKWQDGTVNASAQQFFGMWIVNMYGGLARHSAVTKDGFALVLCHEIGHHLGGVPRVQSWASNEGQADYFGTMKCLRRMYENDDNSTIISKMEIPSTITEKCVAKYASELESSICQRIAMSGQSLANLFQELRKLPKAPHVDTPDTNIVSQTNNKHPHPQCRLDTYFAGALCEKSYDQPVSSTDPLIGTCNRIDGYTEGVRSKCWYAPAS